MSVCQKKKIRGFNAIVGVSMMDFIEMYLLLAFMAKINILTVTVLTLIIKLKAQA